MLAWLAWGVAGAMTPGVDLVVTPSWMAPGVLTRFERSAGEPSVRVGPTQILRARPRCATSRQCVEAALRVVDEWPVWQRTGIARDLLGVHCDDGAVDACIALDVVAEVPTARPCLDEAPACIAYVEAVDTPHRDTLLERACEAGHGEACVLRGEGLSDTERVGWLDRACRNETACDQRDALQLEIARDGLGDRCDAADGSACRELAEALGEDGAHRERSADDWMLEACVHDDERGCQAFEFATARFGLDDERVRVRLEELAVRCDVGDAGACRVTGALLRRTKVRDLRYGEALARLGSGCALGDGRSCDEAGAFRRYGKARKIDDGPEQHWRAGCSADHPSSCASLGDHLYARRKTRAEGVETLEHGCDVGSGRACSSLGDLVRRRDDEAAMARYDQGCDLGDGRGCRALGERALGRERLKPEHDAFPAFVLACDSRDADSCLEVADAHKRRKTAWDDEERYRRTKLGCESGSIGGVFACREQAVLLRKGIGVEKDKRAGKALAKAYSKKRPPRMVRVTVGTGFPAVAALGGEVLVPSQTRIGLFGEFSGIGYGSDSALSDLTGGSEARFVYAAGMARFYPSRRGTGFYVAGGFTFQSLQISLIGLDEPATSFGATTRIGLAANGGFVISGLEVGLTTVPVPELPIVPTVALRFGLSPR